MFILNNSRAGGPLGVLDFIGTRVSVCRLSTKLYSMFFTKTTFFNTLSQENICFSNETTSLELHEHLLVYDFKTLLTLFFK